MKRYKRETARPSTSSKNIEGGRRAYLAPREDRSILSIIEEIRIDRAADLIASERGSR